MATDDVPSVAGPSLGNNHMMPMTSQLHLSSSPQQLQPAVTAVCLPVSVQQLTYDDGDFYDYSDDDGNNAVDTKTTEGDLSLKVSSSTLYSERLAEFQIHTRSVSHRYLDRSSHVTHFQIY